MQKEVRIIMLHPLCHDVESFLKYVGLQELSSVFNFVWEENEPDYVIVSEHINTNQHYRDMFRQLFNKNNIKIYYAGEAEYPDFNLYDYAVGFNPDLQLNDRYSPLPSPFKFFGDGFVSTEKNDIENEEAALKELQRKTGFCNFFYSNPNAHPMRDRLFHEISKYKRVDSLGKHLNNVKEAGTGFVGHANECTVKKSHYKFSIASENAIFPGYTSEKILTSLEAHTVPIYWGDPLVVRHINPDCFINCNNFETIEEIIEEICRVDKDNHLWCRMISQPWQTDKQSYYDRKLNENYLNFFNRIFSMSFQECTRLAMGTRPNTYRHYYFKAKSDVTSKFSIAVRKLKRYIGLN